MRELVLEEVSMVAGGYTPGDDGPSGTPEPNYVEVELNYPHFYDSNGNGDWDEDEAWLPTGGLASGDDNDDDGFPDGWVPIPMS
jgi:hypothetical protein